LGSNRIGYTTELELRGEITGNSSGIGGVSFLTGLFSNQLKTLEVTVEDVVVIGYTGVFVNDISFDDSYYRVSEPVNYTIKLSHYDGYASGVIDESNSYSFTNNNDGSISVSHKIAAKGVSKNNASDSLQNAINFVNQFVGKNPYTNCMPAFNMSGSGVLITRSETIDRPASTYSVVEEYRYNTGALTPYVVTHSLDINDSPNNDYKTYSWRGVFQGSPINKNIEAVRSAVTDFYPAYFMSNYYGIPTGALFQTDFSAVEDTGSATVELSATFVSGLSGGDLSGYFSYNVSMDYNMIEETKSFSIRGEFVVPYGGLAYKNVRIAAFKAANPDYIDYLYDLVTSSPLGVGYITGGLVLNPVPDSYSVSESSGQARFELGATFNDKDTYEDYGEGIRDVTYGVTVDMARWIYDSMASVNIEGHYTVQDLQVSSKDKASINISCNFSGSGSNVRGIMDGLLTSLSGIFTENAYINNENVTIDNEGKYSQSLQTMGDATVPETLSRPLVGVISFPILRQKGYKFGY
jgi:hypothetical protein